MKKMHQSVLGVSEALCGPVFLTLTRLRSQSYCLTWLHAPADFSPLFAVKLTSR